MTNDDNGALDELLQRYRAACPEIEPSANFMPGIWEKIESRRSFWFAFQHVARTAMTASTALCLLLLILNFVAAPQNRLAPTYVDALAADHSAEQTYYAEGIRNTAETNQAPIRFH
jgi:uncharacterized membrane protein